MYLTKVFRIARNTSLKWRKEKTIEQRTTVLYKKRFDITTTKNILRTIMLNLCKNLFSNKPSFAFGHRIKKLGSQLVEFRPSRNKTKLIRIRKAVPD